MPTLVPVDYDPFEEKNTLGVKSKGAMEVVKEWLPTTWPAKLAQGIWEGVKSGATLPGDVYAGKVEPNSDEALHRTWDMLGMLGGGGIPLAEKNALGIFGGRRAQGVDKNALVKASDLERKGANAEDIWKQTGWHRAADDEWKFEIPDYKAELTDLVTTGIGKEHYLKDMLDHPELYKAYPEIGRIPLTVSNNLPAGVSGFANMPGGKTPRGAITVGTEALLEDGKFRDTLLHEIQHQVQAREHFAQGGYVQNDLGKIRPFYNELLPKYNETVKKLRQGLMDDLPPEKLEEYNTWLKNFTDYKNALNKQAWRDYADLAGEVEARNVSKRSRYSLEELQKSLPRETEDVPREWQVVSKKPASGTRGE